MHLTTWWQVGTEYSEVGVFLISKFLIFFFTYNFLDFVIAKILVYFYIVGVTYGILCRYLGYNGSGRTIGL